MAQQTVTFKDSTLRATGKKFGQWTLKTWYTYDDADGNEEYVFHCQVNFTNGPLEFKAPADSAAYAKLEDELKKRGFSDFVYSEKL
jgi:hypothetical protein